MRRALLIAVIVPASAPATASADGAFVSTVSFTDPDVAIKVKRTGRRSPDT